MHKHKNLHTLSLAVFSLIVLGGAILPAIVSAAGLPSLHTLFPNRRHPVVSSGSIVVTTGTLGGIDSSKTGSDGVTYNVFFNDDDMKTQYSVDVSTAKIPVGIGGGLTVSPRYFQQGDRVTLQGVKTSQDPNSTVVVASLISNTSMIRRGFMTGRIIQANLPEGMFLVRLNNGQIAGVDASLAFGAVSASGKSGPVIIQKLAMGGIVNIFGHNLTKMNQDGASDFVYQGAIRKFQLGQSPSLLDLSIAPELSKVAGALSSADILFDQSKHIVVHADYIVDVSPEKAVVDQIDFRLINPTTKQYNCVGLECEAYLLDYK